MSMTNIVASYIQRIIGGISFKREKTWPWKVEDIGLIEAFREGSVADTSHNDMFITVYDIKRITYH